MTARLTPAQRHFARVTAEQAAAQAAPGGRVVGSAYELMLAKLTQDRRRLKAVQSVQRKIEIKRAELLPEYDQWIDGALSGGHGAQDDVLTTVLVWHIDAGNHERALQIAEYAVAHGMTLPDQYSRDIPTMLMDEFAGAYFGGGLEAGSQQAIDVLVRVCTLTDKRDAPDQARAKLYKALGLALRDHVEQADGEEIAPDMLPYARQARHHLGRALELFESVGVKKDIERLDRKLKKAEPEATPSTP